MYKNEIIISVVLSIVFIKEVKLSSILVLVFLENLSQAFIIIISTIIIYIYDK